MRIRSYETRLRQVTFQILDETRQNTNAVFVCVMIFGALKRKCHKQNT